MSNVFESFAPTIGASSDDEKKTVAWNNVPIVLGTALKRDCDGRWILWDEYGKRGTYGWEVDHIVPKAFGGLDVWSNLRARHWLGNSQAGGFAGSLLRQLAP
jgi:hypothetical protein